MHGNSILTLTFCWIEASMLLTKSWMMMRTKVDIYIICGGKHDYIRTANQ